MLLALQQAQLNAPALTPSAAAPAALRSQASGSRADGSGAGKGDDAPIMGPDAPLMPKSRARLAALTGPGYFRGAGAALVQAQQSSSGISSSLPLLAPAAGAAAAAGGEQPGSVPAWAAVPLGDHGDEAPLLLRMQARVGAAWTMLGL